MREEKEKALTALSEEDLDDVQGGAGAQIRTGQEAFRATKTGAFVNRVLQKNIQVAGKNDDIC